MHVADSNRQRIILKFISLLSIVRWYNILIVSMALMLSAVFLLNPSAQFKATLLNPKLYFEIGSIAFLMMAGFIINAFYDFEKDIINRPEETIFGRIVSKSFCLNTYVFFIFCGLLLTLGVNWEVAVFNFLFSFGLWFYSHKLRKKPLTGEISASLLTIAPFFSISLVYQSYNLMTILFVGYIFVLALTREVIKKMIGLKGDLIVGEKSLPIIIGIKKTKYIILSLMLLALGCIAFLYKDVIILPIVYYFGVAVIAIALSIWELKKCKIAKDYERINLIYKLLIVFGVLAIPLVGKWW
ncbi:MAG: geranylgeranylglycerol-phosphate geranylgeranyltransferase [Flavobacteriales bacterium]|nr:geranylgeranylglycerol-phosphate geranylgeranyltransferase [Flavobacteriales bacterium]